MASLSKRLLFSVFFLQIIFFRIFFLTNPNKKCLVKSMLSCVFMLIRCICVIIYHFHCMLCCCSCFILVYLCALFNVKCSAFFISGWIFLLNFFSRRTFFSFVSGHIRMYFSDFSLLCVAEVFSIYLHFGFCLVFCLLFGIFLSISFHSPKMWSAKYLPIHIINIVHGNGTEIERKLGTYTYTPFKHYSFTNEQMRLQRYHKVPFIRSALFIFRFFFFRLNRKFLLMHFFAVLHCTHFSHDMKSGVRK